MMKYIAVFLLIIGVGFMTKPADAKMGRCLLQVDRNIYLNGPCEVQFDALDKRSFTIGVGEKNRTKYFAYVNMDSDGAHGFWNESPENSHAETSLGMLKRNGACWENKTARVCAYK